MQILFSIITFVRFAIIMSGYWEYCTSLCGFAVFVVWTTVVAGAVMIGLVVSKMSGLCCAQSMLMHQKNNLSL